MKEEEANSNGTIWACLHGELDGDARNALNRELERDPGLRKRFEVARRLDFMLRTTLPSLGADGMADDAIAVQALAAWEREQAAAARPAQAFFPRRAAIGVAGLAAAAALVLAVSPALRTPGGVSWTEPVFAPLLLRGAGNDSVGAPLAPGAAAQCQEALSAALRRALEARGAAVPRTSLSLRFQELRGGAFSVAVTARQRDGRVVGEWGGDYSGVQAFLSQADASAGRIAETLAASSPTGVRHAEERK